jgi:uncharacterized protein YbjT (DUF2867 family)
LARTHCDTHVTVAWRVKVTRMTPRPSLRVLVTGATGLQGGTVARALVQRGHRVRAVVRNPQAAAAMSLKDLGVELALGSWEDTGAMCRAAEGIDAMFLHTVPWWVGALREHELAASLAHAALKQGIGHVVLSSAAGADHSSGINVLESKERIETHLRAQGLPLSVVAPAFLMDNFLAPLWFGGISNGTFPIPLLPHQRIQMVCMENVAQTVVHFMENQRAFLGHRLALASDDLSCDDIAQVLSRSTRRTIVHQVFPLEEVEKVNPQLVYLFRWMAERGHGIDVNSTKRELPSVAWQSLDAWATRQDWSVLDVAPPMVHDHDHAH